MLDGFLGSLLVVKVGLGLFFVFLGVHSGFSSLVLGDQVFFVVQVHVLLEVLLVGGLLWVLDCVEIAACEWLKGLGNFRCC